jgi:hypothetical protein
MPNHVPSSRKKRDMKIRKTIAAIAAAGVLSLAAACGVTATTVDDSAGTSTGTSSSSSSTDGSGSNRGPGAGVDVSSVDTEAELVALIQEAYGDASLDLHRGHQPVQDVLDEVLTISHDELHVRMNAGQNLAAVATDLGIDPQTLIDALVQSWSPAIDNALAAGAITEEEAAAYEEALTEAFTFRVNWDGEAETPAFSGLDA